MKARESTHLEGGRQWQGNDDRSVGHGGSWTTGVASIPKVICDRSPNVFKCLEAAEVLQRIPDLMAGHSEQVHAQLIAVYRDLPHCLAGVRVQHWSVFPPSGV